MAAAATNDWVTAKYDADNPKALRALIAAGAKLQPFSPQILEASFNAANEVYAGLVAKNENFKKVFESQKAFRKEEVLWFRVAENTFDNFMARQSAADKL
jgi:TRAP-type mannitol/chloroaromatic compound transport system substrate-binding protein